MYCNSNAILKSHSREPNVSSSLSISHIIYELSGINAGLSKLPLLSNVSNFFRIAGSFFISNESNPIDS